MCRLAVRGVGSRKTWRRGLSNGGRGLVPVLLIHSFWLFNCYGATVGQVIQTPDHTPTYQDNSVAPQ